MNIQRLSNPFGNEISAETTNSKQGEVEREIQEVQASLVIAKRFPRDKVKAVDNILAACCRPTLAEKSLYCFPRGKVNVVGPTIRLAEAMAQSWGNIDYGVKEISNHNGVSEFLAYAWDLETNTRQRKQFFVEHVRHTRNGSMRLTDPRDIYELVANNAARRLRACILGIIPGDVTELAEKQCHETQTTNLNVTPETIKSMVDAFSKNFGVTEDLIQKRIQKRVSAINAVEMLNIKRIYQSLKDGMSKPSDWFDVAESDSAQPKISDFSEKLTENLEESATYKSLKNKLLETKSAEDAQKLTDLKIFQRMPDAEKQKFSKDIEAHISAIEAFK